MRKIKRSMKKIKKKAILFDLDGTLIDSSEGITKSAQYALRHYGIEESDLKKLYRFIGPPLADSFEKWYGFSRAQAVEAVDVFRERYQSIGYLECELYPDTGKVLESLKQMGYFLGVATSKPEVTARIILKDKGVDCYFDAICGATMDGRIEKKADVIRELLKREPDYAISDMILVGDTAFDMQGANLLGMDSVAVSFGFGDVAEMKEAGALDVLDSMNMLLEYFKR